MNSKLRTRSQNVVRKSIKKNKNRVTLQVLRKTKIFGSPNNKTEIHVGDFQVLSNLNVKANNPIAHSASCMSEFRFFHGSKRPILWRKCSVSEKIICIICRIKWSTPPKHSDWTCRYWLSGKNQDDTQLFRVTSLKMTNRKRREQILALSKQMWT